MPSISSSYRGPLIIIGLGGGFSVVGAVPVAITFSIGVKTSATVIGMGFVTFGFLLMLPGFFWCVVVRTDGFKACCYCCLKSHSNPQRHKRRRKKWRHEDDDDYDDDDDDEDDEDDDFEEDRPALSNYEHNRPQQLRKQPSIGDNHWPSHVYLDAPALLITSSDSYLNPSECLQLQQMQVDIKAASSATTPAAGSVAMETDDEKTTTSLMQHSSDSEVANHNEDDNNENNNKCVTNSVNNLNNITTNNTRNNSLSYKHSAKSQLTKYTTQINSLSGANVNKDDLEEINDITNDSASNSLELKNFNYDAKKINHHSTNIVDVNNSNNYNSMNALDSAQRTDM